MRAADLVPRRFTRTPEECPPLLTHHAADRVFPDGSVQPGEVIALRSVPGSGWRWLGRVWRFRPA